MQTVVYRKGMAKTLNQSRQLISHGFISINGRRIKSPSYLVKKNEESGIGYYKKISIENATPQAPMPEVQSTTAAVASENNSSDKGE